MIHNILTSIAIQFLVVSMQTQFIAKPLWQENNNIKRVNANVATSRRGQNTVIVASPQRIAHAGGEYNNMTYTNSLEALEANYAKGYRFFEVDLNMTTDGAVVLLHDWGTTYQKLTGQDGMTDQETFIRSGEAAGLTLLDTKRLFKWMETRKDSYVILDTKIEIISILKKIARQNQALTDRFIPFIYDLDHYDHVKELGFSKLIYLSQEVKDEDIVKLNQYKNDKNFSVALAREVNISTVKRISSLDIRTYVWTINDFDEESDLRLSGAYGVITDFLPPK